MTSTTSELARMPRRATATRRAGDTLFYMRRGNRPPSCRAPPLPAWASPLGLARRRMQVARGAGGEASWPPPLDSVSDAVHVFNIDIYWRTERTRVGHSSDPLVSPQRPSLSSSRQGPRCDGEHLIRSTSCGSTSQASRPRALARSDAKEWHHTKLRWAAGLMVDAGRRPSD